MDKSNTQFNRATIYESFIQYADSLPDDAARGLFYTGVLKYSMYGQEPNFTEGMQAVFALIRPVIDKSNSRRSVGEKGGKQSGSKCEAKQKQMRSKTEANAKQTAREEEQEEELELELEQEDNKLSCAKSAALPLAAPSGPDSIFSFDEFWETYNLKTDRAKCEAKYRRLTRAEREAIRAALPRYVAGTFTDGRYPSRKNPLTWINGRCWLDEAVPAPHTDQPQQSRAEREMAELEAFARSQQP